MMMMMMSTEVPNHIGPFGILKISWNVSVQIGVNCWGIVAETQGVSLFTGISSIYRLEAQQNLQKTAMFVAKVSESSATKFLCMCRYDSYDTVW